MVQRGSQIIDSEEAKVWCNANGGSSGSVKETAAGSMFECQFSGETVQVPITPKHNGQGVIVQNPGKGRVKSLDGVTDIRLVGTDLIVTSRKEEYEYVTNPYERSPFKRR